MRVTLVFWLSTSAFSRIFLTAVFTPSYPISKGVWTTSAWMTPSLSSCSSKGEPSQPTRTILPASRTPEALGGPEHAWFVGGEYSVEIGVGGKDVLSYLQAQYVVALARLLCHHVELRVIFQTLV